MVSVAFDANNVAPYVEKQITISVGSSKSHQAWTERKTFSVAELREILSTHYIGPKDGPCFTPAIFRGHKRNKNDADQIDIIVLDADCGHECIDIERSIARHDWEAIIHSTHSHLTTHTTVSAKHYDKWCSEHKGGTTEQYLSEYKSYLPEVSLGAEVESRSTDGKEVTIKHQPCPKFRIVLPLSRSWKASDFSSQEEANAVWAERIDALAAFLGLHHDQSCTDTSRLFYFPRAPQGVPVVARSVTGELCDIWSLPAAKKEPRQGDLLNTSHEQKKYKDWNGKQHDLRDWAALYANRYQIVDAISARSPHIFGSRISGVKRHIECPFEPEHTAIGRNGTFAINASQIGQSGLSLSGFQIRCSHNACRHRDRLDLLSGMITNGWLSHDDLYDDQFIIKESWEVDPVPADDDEPEPVEPPAMTLPMPDGVVKMVYDHIIGSSLFPHPDLALAAALQVVGTAMGRRYGWGNLRSNLYIIGLAYSASGKNHVLSQAENLLHAAGFEACLAGSDPSSGSAVTSQLRDHPVSLYVVDEIGGLIEALCDKKADKHTKEIIKNLTIIYSKANGIFKSKDYADRKANPTSSIRQPHLGVFGLSVETRVWKSITKDNIADGSLARFMLFESKSKYPEWNESCVNPDPSPALITAIKNVALHGGNGGNLSDIVPGNSQIDPDIRQVTVSTEVTKYITTIMRGQSKFLNSHIDSGLAPIYGRVLENAKKVAMIHAVGRNPAAARIEKCDIEFGIDLVDALTRDMINNIKKRVSENEYEAVRKRVLAIIKKNQTKIGMRKNDLTRATQFLSGSAERDSLIRDLLEAELIRETVSQAGSNRVSFYHTTKKSMS